MDESIVTAGFGKKVFRNLLVKDEVIFMYLMNTVVDLSFLYFRLLELPLFFLP